MKQKQMFEVEYTLKGDRGSYSEHKTEMVAVDFADVIHSLEHHEFYNCILFRITSIKKINKVIWFSDRT